MAETNLQVLERQRKEKEARELQIQSEEAKLFSYDSLSAVNNMRKDMILIAHKQVAKGTSMSEFAYFLEYCKGIGLNPLLKEVWCYKNNKGDVVMFAGKDGFVKKAKEEPLYMGYSSAYVCENDFFILDIPNCFVDHNFGAKDRGKVVGAYCWVKSKDKEIKHDVLVWAPLEGFDKKQAVWNDVPHEMIKKVAESHALKQFVGVPGLQNEYEFKIDKNNIVSHIAEIPIEQKQEEKQEKRLQTLIENANSIEALRKFGSHCQTPELVELYNKKKDELNQTGVAEVIESE